MALYLLPVLIGALLIGQVTSRACSAPYHGAKCDKECPERCPRCKEGPSPNLPLCIACAKNHYGIDRQCFRKCEGDCLACEDEDGSCTECPPGRYSNENRDCNFECTNCVGGCHTITGDCLGDECTGQYWGPGCSWGCDERIRCKGGVCPAPKKRCPACQEGYWNDYCNSYCYYGCDGGCDQTNGFCECKAGYYGDRCGDACSDGCNGECDKNSGLCTECKQGFYGDKCEQKCPEMCDGGCDRISGLCTACIKSYHGYTCDQTCKNGCFDQECDIDTGICGKCKDGKKGDYCDKSCHEKCKSCHRYKEGCTACTELLTGINCDFRKITLTVLEMSCTIVHRLNDCDFGEIIGERHWSIYQSPEKLSKKWKVGHAAHLRCYYVTADWTANETDRRPVGYNRRPVLQWFKDGKPLAKTPGNYVWEAKEIEHIYLTVFPVDNSAEGRYTCQAREKETLVILDEVHVSSQVQSVGGIPNIQMILQPLQSNCTPSCLLGHEDSYVVKGTIYAQNVTDDVWPINKNVILYRLYPNYPSYDRGGYDDLDTEYAINKPCSIDFSKCNDDTVQSECRCTNNPEPGQYEFIINNVATPDLSQAFLEYRWNSNSTNFLASSFLASSAFVTLPIIEKLVSLEVTTKYTGGLTIWECTWTTPGGVDETPELEWQKDGTKIVDIPGHFLGNITKGKSLIVDPLDYINKPRYTCLGQVRHFTDTVDVVITEPESDDIVKGCINKRMDIYFLLDSSGSISDFMYTREQDFVKEVIKRLDPKDYGTRVGVLTFGTNVHTPPSLNLWNAQGKQDTLDNINKENLPFLSGLSNIDVAIRYVRQHGGFRMASTNVIVVVTDGGSRSPRATKRETDVARAEGIFVFYVGMGYFVDVDELDSMKLDEHELASLGPGELNNNFVLYINENDNVTDVAQNLTEDACMLPSLRGEPDVCEIERSGDVIWVAAPGGSLVALNLIDIFNDRTYPSTASRWKPNLRLSYFLDQCGWAKRLYWPANNCNRAKPLRPVTTRTYIDLMKKAHSRVVESDTSLSAGATPLVYVLVVDKDSFELDRQGILDRLGFILKWKTCMIVDLNLLPADSKELQDFIEKHRKANSQYIPMNGGSILSQRKTMMALNKRICHEINTQWTFDGLIPNR